MRRPDKPGFAKGGALLSLLAHLLLLRLLVGEGGNVLPPDRSYRELPLLVGLVEQEAELPLPPGMPEALPMPSSGESGPTAMDRAGEEPTFSGEEGVFAGPMDEAELGPFGESVASEVVEPNGLFLPDAPPLKLADRRWEGEVRVGIYVDEEGRPGKVWVIESSGRREADLDALEFFRLSRWRPATVNGEPVGWVVERTVAYRQPALFW